MTLNMGPQHPSTHGVLRIMLELEGETIRGAQPDIGFLHTGIEKECEQKNWQQVVTLTDRVDYLANLSNNLVYALAVEKLLQIEIPRARAMDARDDDRVFAAQQSSGVAGNARARYRRDERVLLLLPRTRRHSAHLRNVLRPAHDDQLHPRRRAGAGASARLAESGREIHPGISQQSGRIREPAGCESDLDAAHKGVGFISLEDMLDLGVTGPMIRAAGLQWDIRKSEPYSSYEKFDFEVPTRTENDVYARYRVRLDEMRQSARIITQALEGMPEGAWQADAPHVVLPDREKMKTQMEALIYHFKIVTEGFRVPAGEVYQCIESPRGEIGYYIVSDGTSKPYRVHMRTPSFGNLQALPVLLKDMLIADSIAALGSMDFVLGDTDR